MSWPESAINKFCKEHGVTVRYGCEWPGDRIRFVMSRGDCHVARHVDRFDLECFLYTPMLNEMLKKLEHEETK